VDYLIFVGASNSKLPIAFFIATKQR